MAISEVFLCGRQVHPLHSSVFVFAKHIESHCSFGAVPFEVKEILSLGVEGVGGVVGVDGSGGV